MSLFVLDTDTFSLFREGEPHVCSRVLRTAPSHLALTVITVEEALSGWYALLRRAKSPDKTAAAYSRLADTVVAVGDFRILPFPVSAIGRFESLRRARVRIAGNDLRIAETVLDLGATLVTRNIADFTQVPGLSIVDWSR